MAIVLIEKTRFKQLNSIRRKVAAMSGCDAKEVRIVVSPYRICPLGAHIDHQGGTVSAMTIDKGIILGFVPSSDCQVLLQSGQFKGEVKFRVDEEQLPENASKSNNSGGVKNSSVALEECGWGNYARGAIYALQKRGNHLKQGIVGFIRGEEGLDSSGLSSSAAVGVAYLLAFESANKLKISPTENIEYDRLIENEYLGLRNGILDQSAILLSSYGCLTCMDCKSQVFVEIALPVQTKEHRLISSPDLNRNLNVIKKQFKILLAFSGLKQALTTNPGYNSRVAECRDAARILLQASGIEGLEPILSNVEPEVYEEHKSKLDATLLRRAEHYFSENKRVLKGLEAWASGNLEDFGKLISASGLSSIQNYESGCEPLIQLYEILVKAPGVFGTRFSGAGFRGCCIAFVDTDRAYEAASFTVKEYTKVQPKLASQIDQDKMVLICDAGDCACVI
ncbi:galacturonokinase-like isoform X1 [Salvia splendens]|uniref:galacturonokinase-like isoform X1 n=1 Tax=Salvia splendens TaxID=180675 RepID=UPI001C263EE5|nr:galacturonokinase-like isoform X1 [Salvia splendens]XP_042050895.1 galacturonokinase-like isoform X1 [Salvia splendens]